MLMSLLRPIQYYSAPITQIQKANGVQQIYLWRQKIVCHGELTHILRKYKSIPCANILRKGREIPARYFRRCLRSSRYSCYYKQICRYECMRASLINPAQTNIERQRLPHLLFYGPPGTGKTSTILALARRIYGAKNMRQMVLELNASDDRGIEVVREQIKTFASTKQIFSMGSAAAAPGAYKLTILDEADAMTSTAQMALRRVMEKYTANTRFCVIANYTHKLSPALLSRCTRFRFSPLKERDIRVLVDKVIVEENVQINAEATDALVRLSKGDMRRALNVLQACHASSKLFSDFGRFLGS